MFDRLFSFLTPQKRLSFDEIRSVQAVSDQVVLSIEQSMTMPGPRKKELALEVAGSILKDLGIVAPDSIVHTAIEASVCVMNLLDKKESHS